MPPCKCRRPHLLDCRNGEWRCVGRGPVGDESVAGIAIWSVVGGHAHVVFRASVEIDNLEREGRRWSGTGGETKVILRGVHYTAQETLDNSTLRALAANLGGINVSAAVIVVVQNNRLSTHYLCRRRRPNAQATGTAIELKLLK